MGVCLSIKEVHLACKELIDWPIPKGTTMAEALRTLVKEVGEDRIKELQKEWKKKELNN